MEEQVRRSALAVLVTDDQRDIVKALAFIQEASISEILYRWLRPQLDKAAARADVQAIIAQKAKTTAAK